MTVGGKGGWVIKDGSLTVYEADDVTDQAFEALRNLVAIEGKDSAFLAPTGHEDARFPPGAFDETYENWQMYRLDVLVYDRMLNRNTVTSG